MHLLLALVGAPVLAVEPEPEDPYLWLEEVTSDEALEWVRARNETSVAAISAAPGFQELEQRVLSILDSDDRIPYVGEMGGLYYNFWRDGEHPRGVWRRTTLESYRTDAPEWEVVLDLDALAEAEGESWVWKGADCLPHDETRCLLALSRGGADATVVREYDLPSRSFVEDGFVLPEAKSDVSWIDRDHVYVGTDFGEGSLTTSGYARIAKRWTRGTPLEEAVVVFEGEPDDVAAGLYHDPTPGFELDIAFRRPTFFEGEVWVLRGDDRVRVDKPLDAEVTFHREWILFEPASDWTVGKTTWPAGSLLVARRDDWLAGRKKLSALFTPTETTSLAGFSATRHHLLLNVLEDVRSRVEVLTPKGRRWTREPLAGLPELGAVSVSPVDSETSDAFWVYLSDYVTPSSLLLGEVGGGAPELVKQLPAMYDATGLEVSQHFATSADGTRVPYFQVSRADLPLDGSTPTLLYGYGGFQVSLLPGYRAEVGAAWLERGGVYVVANIRGGGEYGPRWHQAALKANRHKAYEDFEAVAEDLIRRGVTSTPRLGTMGGSNGGLLMGNMLVRRPDLWGAIVCAVPLLDMRRYHTLLAGASWMGEYGNPDVPDEWEFIRGFSPYHLFDPAVAYPPILFATSTRDDRVHPAHARKMAAKMLEAGAPVTYYENIEGGHGGAANNAQRAFMAALEYTYLWETLTSE